MPCQLCDKEIDIEKTNPDGTHVDIPEPHTKDMYVHSVAGFIVCLNCKEKVLQFFRDLVKI